MPRAEWLWGDGEHLPAQQLCAAWPVVLQLHVQAWDVLGEALGVAKGLYSSLERGCSPDLNQFLLNLFLKSFSVGCCICCYSWCLKKQAVAALVLCLGWFPDEVALNSKPPN